MRKKNIIIQYGTQSQNLVQMLDADILIIFLQMDVPTYNPMNHIEGKNVIRLKVGVTPSERKAFRNDERIRLNNLNDGN